MSWFSAIGRTDQIIIAYAKNGVLLPFEGFARIINTWWQVLTMGFIESGNAELCCVALSQVMDPKIKEKGTRWDIPSNLHEPINST